MPTPPQLSLSGIRFGLVKRHRNERLTSALPPSIRAVIIAAMCGRYASFLPAEAIARIFGAANPLSNLAPSWNVAPTQSALVVRRHPETAERHLDLLSQRRCIVHADAFYEWKVVGGGKRPYAIARQDGRPLAFAGIWESFCWPDERCFAASLS